MLDTFKNESCITAIKHLMEKCEKGFFMQSALHAGYIENVLRDSFFPLNETTVYVNKCKK